MLLRRCSLAAMGHSHVSRMLWSKPVGSAQAATAAPGDPSGLQGDSHSRQIAEEVLKEGLPRVPRHLKAGPRLGALGAGAGAAAAPGRSALEQSRLCACSPERARCDDGLAQFERLFSLSYAP